MGGVALYALACYWLAGKYLSPKRIVAEPNHFLSEILIPTKEGNDPSFVTEGFAKGKPKGVVFIFAHGYGGNRGNWPVLMPELAKHGFECVAPSMNGQDASPDPTVGFGPKEAQTILSTIKWVRGHSEPGTKIVLYGLSMGGSAAWLASQLDPTVAGVITEGAYARFDEATESWFKRFGSGANVYLRPVIWFATAKSGIKPATIVPLEGAAAWKGRPALVIQAENDQLIPRSHADRLAKAAGCEEWIVSGAEHAFCYEAVPDEYLGKLVAFAKRL